jgi:hypothetical protein
MATLDAFCQVRAKVECYAPVLKQCGGIDPKKCQDSRARFCTANVPQGTEFVSKNAPACIKIIQDAYADGNITADEQRKIDAACTTTIFSGPGIARSVCTGPYDCRSADDLTCILPFKVGGPDPNAQGKCLKPNPVATGAACVGEADQCPDTDYCDPKGKICVTAASSGQSCNNYDVYCRTGLSCKGTMIGIPGACTGAFPLGHTCETNEECSSSLCTKQSDQPDGNCTEGTVFNPASAACDSFK